MEWLDPIRTMLPASANNIFVVSIAIVVIGLAWGVSLGAARLPQRFLPAWRGVIMTVLQFLVLLGGLVAIAMLAGLAEAVVFAAIAAVFLIGSAFYSDTRLSRPINRARKLLGKPAVEAEIVDGSVGAKIASPVEHVEATPTVVTVDARSPDATDQESPVDVLQAEANADQDLSPPVQLPVWHSRPVTVSHDGIGALRKRPTLGKQTTQGLRVTRGR